jgi:hypothetical protein
MQTQCSFGNRNSRFRYRAHYDDAEQYSILSMEGKRTGNGPQLNQIYRKSMLYVTREKVSVEYTADYQL